MKSLARPQRRVSWRALLGRASSALLFAAAVAGCAPRLKPLPGAPARADIPRAEIPPGRHLVVFRWELEDPDLIARGEGAARIAAPDSARLDFFLGGGAGSGAAVLVGDTLRLPSSTENLARRLVPIAPLLWATLGRLSIPAARDTVARVDGDTLRADIGSPVEWRLAFASDSLRRLERVERGRVIEWVERLPGGRVRYRHEANRRQLDLAITRTQDAIAFDPAIWTLP